MNLNLIYLTAFVTVAEHLNFTTAAKALYITQPALSRQISQLEEVFGVSLFDRNKRSVSLTKEGAVLLDYAKDIVTRYNEMMSRASELSVGINNRLFLGLWGSLDKDYILPFFRKYASIHQEDKLSFKRYSFYSTLASDLTNGLLDIAFAPHYCVTKKDFGDSIQVASVGTIEAYVAASPNHPLANQQTISIRQLANERIVLLSRMESFYRRALSKAEVTPLSIESSIDMDTLLFQVSVGNGVAIVTPNIRNYYIDEIHLLKLEEDVADFDVMMMWRSNGKTPSCNRFLKMVQSMIPVQHGTGCAQEQPQAPKN